MKIIRAIIIGTVAICVVWFGARFGPATNDAEAKVFERFQQITNNMPAFLFDEQAVSKPRKVMVNGFTTWLTVSKTKESISDVLKFYEGQYKPQQFEEIPKNITEKITDPGLIKKMDAVKFAVGMITENQHFVLKRENYGFWGGFEFQDPELKIGSEKWFEEMKSVYESGEFGEIATGRVVIAIGNNKNSEKTVLNIWTDRDFNINNIMPDASGDVSGGDIADVPRYPQNKRTFTVEQDNPQGTYRVVMYEGGGSVAGNVLFYHSRMEDNGWRPDPVFEQVMQQQSKENTMFYVKGDRECTIQIDKGDSGRIMTTVIEKSVRQS